MADRRGGVDGVAGGGGLTVALRQAPSKMSAAKMRKRSVFKTLSDDVKERVGNSRITSFRWMESVRADQFARHAAKRLIEVDDRRGFAGGHRANLIVRRDDIVGAETTAGSVHAERALRQQGTDVRLHPPIARVAHH